jgi:AcrR family transcriptional regulator
VSIGTLYNRFGSREGLIEAVIPDVADARIRAVEQDVLAHDTPRARLVAFLRAMIDLQQDDRALNDAILRRHQGARQQATPTLDDVCGRSLALGRRLVDEARADGSLAADFTADDLISLLWLAGIARRESDPPDGWRRMVERALDDALR